jgi:hypothetical protein
MVGRARRREPTCCDGDDDDHGLDSRRWNILHSPGADRRSRAMTLSSAPKSYWCIIPAVAKADGDQSTRS